MKDAMIPIQPDACRGPIASIDSIRLTRRSLLKGAGVLTGTLAFSSVLAVLAPSRAWALEMAVLNVHQGAVILAFTRHLYPHPQLDDAVYALVVKALDQKAQNNPGDQQTLLMGVKRLDDIAGNDWLKRSAALQAVDVESMQATWPLTVWCVTAGLTVFSADSAFRDAVPALNGRRYTQKFRMRRQPVTWNCVHRRMSFALSMMPMARLLLFYITMRKDICSVRKPVLSVSREIQSNPRACCSTPSQRCSPTVWPTHRVKSDAITCDTQRHLSMVCSKTK